MKNTKLIFTSLTLALVALFVGCKKDEPKPEPDPPVTTQPTPVAKMDLLANEWILFETLKNGTVETSNGTDEYEFTRNGQFKFKSNGSWSKIGNYTFKSDSSAIFMVFTGLTTAIEMKLDKLDASLLVTKFVSGGNNYEYKYRK